MSKVAQQQGDPVQNVYKQFQGSHLSAANCIEWFYTQVAELKVQNILLRKEKEELERKLLEFKGYEKPKKK